MRRGGGFGAGRSHDDPRRRHGRSGEDLARRYLEHHGYLILQTNYRSRYGEVDIIARRGRVVAFIEVKTRLGHKCGEPFEAVGPRKQNQIRRMAEMWVAEHAGDRELRECEFRFDVVSVKMDDRNSQGHVEAGFAGSAGDDTAHVSGDDRRDDSADDPDAGFAGIVHMRDAFR